MKRISMIPGITVLILVAVLFLDPIVDFLPVDQHMLIASLAPRYVYVSSSSEDTWSDPAAERLACRMTEEAFALYGKKGIVLSECVECDKAYHEGNIGYHAKSGNHGISHYDWKMFLDFLDKKFA